MVPDDSVYTCLDSGTIYLSPSVHLPQSANIFKSHLKTSSRSLFLTVYIMRFLLIAVVHCIVFCKAP